MNTDNNSNKFVSKTNIAQDIRIKPNNWIVPWEKQTPVGAPRTQQRAYPMPWHASRGAAQKTMIAQTEPTPVPETSIKAVKCWLKCAIDAICWYAATASLCRRMFSLTNLISNSKYDKTRVVIATHLKNHVNIHKCIRKYIHKYIHK